LEYKLTNINDQHQNGQKQGEEAAMIGVITDERALMAQGEIVVDQVDESNSQNSKRML